MPAATRLRERLRQPGLLVAPGVTHLGLPDAGIEPTPGSPEQFRAQMQRDLAAYGPIVEAAGIKLE